MLTGRFLLQNYTFLHHKQNIYRLFFAFAYGLSLKIRYRYSRQCVFVDTDKLFIHSDCIMVRQIKNPTT